MVLLIQDRAGREKEQRITNPAEIAAETRRLAGLLGATVESVREDLVGGMVLRTAGYEYSLASMRGSSCTCS